MQSSRRPVAGSSWTEWTGTMWACWSRARICGSSPSAFETLRATSRRPSLTSSARKTRANAPRPSSITSWKSPTTSPAPGSEPLVVETSHVGRPPSRASASGSYTHVTDELLATSTPSHPSAIERPSPPPDPTAKSWTTAEPSARSGRRASWASAGTTAAVPAPALNTIRDAATREPRDVSEGSSSARFHRFRSSSGASSIARKSSDMRVPPHPAKGARTRHAPSIMAATTASRIQPAQSADVAGIRKPGGGCRWASTCTPPSAS